MKCQVLFSGKNKKDINFSSAELAPKRLNVCLFVVVFSAFFFFFFFFFILKMVTN